MLRNVLHLLLLVCLVLTAHGVPAAANDQRPITADPIVVALEAARRAAPEAPAAFEPLAAFTGSSGTTHVRLRQRIDGLEVHGGDLRFALDQSGRVIWHTGDAAHGSAQDPLVSAREAAVIAAAEVRVKAPEPAPDVGSPAADVSFLRGGYVKPPSARLVLVQREGELRTAWKLDLPARFDTWYEVLVDAETGTLISATNLAVDAGPSGSIFDNDPDDGPSIVAMFSGTMPAPRDTWSSTGLTAGNNVVAGDDRDGDGEPIVATIEVHTFTDAYEGSAGGEALPDIETAANNVFYWMNVAHDRFYALGFTEAAGNFQESNYAAGGAEGDPVMALVQFGAGTCDFVFPPCFNDARFITQEEGLPAFATFTLYRPPYRYIDSSFAADVVLHEYVHGVSNRLIGVGWVGGTHAFALGEGWSDFFAASITGDPVFGEYLTGDHERGIRTHAIDQNPYTYADLCAIDPAGCVSHADGGIWAGTLWDIRDALIARYALEAGIRRAEELVTEGMMFTPRHPSFIDARDGVLEADLARSGADHCTLWAIFASRGMGASAAGVNVPPSSTPAFDLPAHCAAFGANSDGDGMPDLYESGQACLEMTEDDAEGDPDSDGLATLREWVRGTAPCVNDTDGDHCGDGAELGVNPADGGGRDPLDPWDFFDVTGDGRIDLADTLDVLAHFGASTGEEAAWRDRFAPDPARPWRTAEERNGVDLHDALVSLKSFGHTCVGDPP